MPRDRRPLVRGARPQAYPPGYRGLLHDNASIKAVQDTHYWRPSCPSASFPEQRKQIWIARLVVALKAFDRIFKMNQENHFTSGAFTDAEIEYAAHLVWDAVRELHTAGVILNKFVDPTITRSKSRGVFVWTIHEDQRNLAPEGRLREIWEQLKAEKGACNAVLTASCTTDIIREIAASPMLTLDKRNKNFQSNQRNTTPARAPRGGRTAIFMAAPALPLPPQLPLPFPGYTFAQVNAQVAALRARFPNFDFSANTFSAARYNPNPIAPIALLATYVTSNQHHPMGHPTTFSTHQPYSNQVPVGYGGSTPSMMARNAFMNCGSDSQVQFNQGDGFLHDAYDLQGFLSVSAGHDRNGLSAAPPVGDRFNYSSVGSTPFDSIDPSGNNFSSSDISGNQFMNDGFPIADPQLNSNEYHNRNLLDQQYLDHNPDFMHASFDNHNPMVQSSLTPTGQQPTLLPEFQVPAQSADTFCGSNFASYHQQFDPWRDQGGV